MGAPWFCGAFRCVKVLQGLEASGFVVLGFGFRQNGQELRLAVSCNRLTYGPTVRLSCWWLRFEVQDLGCRGSVLHSPQYDCNHHY